MNKKKWEEETLKPTLEKYPEIEKIASKFVVIFDILVGKHFLRLGGDCGAVLGRFLEAKAGPVRDSRATSWNYKNSGFIAIKLLCSTE